MRKIIYTTLLTSSKHYAYWVLLLLLPLNFSVFAYTIYMGIINNSPSPITINYRGVLGTPSSYGCGPNYKTVPSTCTVAANGGTRTLNLGESSGDQAQGTITIITHSGQILYDYMLTGERQRLDWILPENPKNKLIPYM